MPHSRGFTVALFYCFLNTEVQNTVRHHFETWKTRRSLGPSRLRSGSRSKDWSPRSRTESIRPKSTLTYSGLWREVEAIVGVDDRIFLADLN
ncbi:hypothetical protein NQ318_009005 [Aromia moschata]|uniref:Secreted protein n=1 Tax=Aromia moschata TaxID=1265417 RepID=A0AAV8YUD4_9CUCU|nr:hypothetical protein NQ318_009005 [Aromia moschata]